MKKVTFSCLALAILLQLIPSNGNAANIQDQKAKIGGGETGGYTLFCQDVQEMFQMYDSALVVRHLLPSLQQMFHPSYTFCVKKTIFVAI